MVGNVVLKALAAGGRIEVAVGPGGDVGPGERVFDEAHAGNKRVGVHGLGVGPAGGGGGLPAQGLLLQFGHKSFLAVAVAFDVVGVTPGQRGLECAVLLCGVFVSAQVVAHGQVAANLRAVILGKDVQLVGALVAPFS